MQQTLLIFLVIISICTNAQEKKVRVGLQLFPNISTGIPLKGSYNYDYYKGIETFVFSYSAGLQIDWTVSKKWKFSTGLLINKTGDRSKIFPPDVYRGFFSPRRYTFRLFYLEVPLMLDLKIKDHLHVQLGVSPMLNFIGQRRTNFEGSSGGFGSIKSDTDFFGLNANLGFAFQVEVGKKDLYISPYLQYSILNCIDQIPFLDYSPARKYIASGLKLTFMF